MFPDPNLNSRWPASVDIVLTKDHYEKSVSKMTIISGHFIMETFVAYLCQVSYTGSPEPLVNNFLPPALAGWYIVMGESVRPSVCSSHFCIRNSPKSLDGISWNFHRILVSSCTCAPPILYFDRIYFWGFPWHNMDLAIYTMCMSKRGYTSCIRNSS